MALTRMDGARAEDWKALERSTRQWQLQMPQRVTAMLEQLGAQYFDGVDVSQLQHCLQTATRAEHAGAAEEMVIAALCHDIGTLISIDNHGPIAAEILRPYVSREACEVVRTHQEFQREHYRENQSRDSSARLRYADQKWFAAACRFSDEWDQESFDPQYSTRALEHFAPLIARVFREPRPNYDQLPRDFWSRANRFLTRRRALWRVRLRALSGRQ